MIRTESGFGGMQILLVAAIVAVASQVAIPKYKAFADKAKITEAMSLAGESKRKIEQAYMVSGHFPKRATDANAMLSQTVSKPEFVREMKIEHDPFGKKVRIKVFLNEGVLENETGEEQFIYISGNQATGGSYSIEWHCGANGFSSELMPDECQS